MHFAIPDTDSYQDGATSVTIFNIHINGAFHCSLRYSQMHRLHEQLQRDLGETTPLPPFPPRKLFALTPWEKEQRRLQLERHIQDVSQLPEVAKDSLFRSFLLHAQRETHEIFRTKAEGGGGASSTDSTPPSDSTLSVFLHNGHTIPIKAALDLATPDLMTSLAEAVSILPDFVPFFGVFLIRTEEGQEDGLKDFEFVRELQDFETPLLSLRASHPSTLHKVLLARRYFDLTVDELLLDNRVTLNLLHVQTLSDVERGWIFTTKDQFRQVESLRKKNSKRELLRFARTLKFYGFVQFRPCEMDYPKPGCKAVICMGGQQLVFRIQMPDGVTKEGVLKVQRMKCWRIVTQIVEEQKQQNGESNNNDNNSNKNNNNKNNNDETNNSETNEQENSENKPETSDVSKENNSEAEPPPPVTVASELSIEYLMAKDSLQWITISSAQAVFMSMCLQTMVDELVAKKETGHVKQRPRPKLQRNISAGFYMRRDGRNGSGADGKTDARTDAKTDAKADVKADTKADTKPIEMKDRKTLEDENEAFGGIGEDDL